MVCLGPRGGVVEGLFFYTVASGCQAINRALTRDSVEFADRQEIVSRGLMILSLSPPYDAIPLQAGTLAQMAFDAQMAADEAVTAEDLPIGRSQIDGRHFLAATEAALGFTLSLLHTYDAVRDWRDQ